MPRKGVKRKAKTKPPDFESALDLKQLEVFLSNLTNEEIFMLSSRTWQIIQLSIGDPTEKRIRHISDDLASLHEVLDFTKVIERLALLDKFERNQYFGVSFNEFFPEMEQVHEACIRRIESMPAGIPKAENWLAPVAGQASVDADLEAAIYFASRGRNDIFDGNGISEMWHMHLCHDIEEGDMIGSVKRDVVVRAKNRTLSLAEAARILAFKSELGRFFAFRDEEENFIDATLF